MLTTNGKIRLDDYTLALEWWPSNNPAVHCLVLVIYRGQALAAAQVHTQRRPGSMPKFSVN